jgi:hypothetical protein
MRAFARRSESVLLRIITLNALCRDTRLNDLLTLVRPQIAACEPEAADNTISSD